MSAVNILIQTNKRTIFREDVDLDRSAELMIFSGCGCRPNCFLNLCEAPHNYVRGIEIIRACQERTNQLTTTERCNYLKDLLRSMEVTHGLERDTYKYCISFKGEKFIVCRNAFILCHDVTNYTLKKAKQEIRAGLNGCSDFRSNATVADSTLAEVNLQMCKSDVSYLDRRAVLNSMKAPHTDRGSKMHAWMSNHFKNMGDHVPNAAGEIHLEPTEKKEIYAEYCVTINDGKPLSYPQFCKYWESSFAYVKIRPYKNVPGKCDLCLKLSMLRKKRIDAEGRQIATQLHAYHQSLYMAERQDYYDRMYQAKLYPHNFVGIISDGMAQNHCKLPHLSNQIEFSNPLPQHLQGVIDSGNEFVIYRTFHTVHLTCDPAIYVLLLQLETRIDPITGKLPDTVYLQVDGGSENANKYLLCTCELLIIRRLCAKVVLTRLPVGHTHENIDAKFGVIWTAARNRTILTPDAYKNMIINACSKNGQRTRVVDIHVVPDFKSFFNDEKCIDKDFGNWAKSEDTQLQFIFEAVRRCSRFPLGVRTTHRAYSSSRVIEIRESPGNAFGFVPVLLEVGTLPEGGMHLLTKLPTQPLKPAAFKANSREKLIKFLDTFGSTLGSTSPAAMEELRVWSQTCPADDDAANHTSMWHVPFGTKLFSSDPLPSEPAAFTELPNRALPSFNGLPMQQQRTGSSVRYRGNRNSVEASRININTGTML